MSQGLTLSRKIGFDQYLICNGLSGVGAVIIGTLAHFALGRRPNTIAAAVVGGLAGGGLGLFV
jgi:hypothetical protein